MKYAFIKRHEHKHSVRRMCLCLAVYPSGYYAWKGEPVSDRSKDDQRLLGLLQHALHENVSQSNLPESPSQKGRYFG